MSITEPLFGDTFVFYDTKNSKLNKNKVKAIEIEIKPATPLQLFEISQENSKIPETEVTLLSKEEIQKKEENFKKKEIQTEVIKKDFPEKPHKGEGIYNELSEITFEAPMKDHSLDLLKGGEVSLKVIQFQAEIESNTFTFTFNQPMVRLGTAEIDRPFFPLKIEPKLNGKLKWFGTKSLKFISEKPFPPSTQFTVSIPKGVKSFLNRSMEESTTFTFSTKCPKLIEKFPSKLVVSNEPLIYLEYDQDIDIKKVFEKIKVTDGGWLSGWYATTYTPKLLSLEEVKNLSKDKKHINVQENINYLIERYNPKRSLWFQMKSPLTFGYKYKVTIGVGVSEVSGNISTTEEEAFAFEVYGTFKINTFTTSIQPDSPVVVKFTNPVNLESFSQNFITVSPEVREYKITPFNDGLALNITGYYTGASKYTVKFKKGIVDIWGQKLEESEMETYTGPCTQFFYVPNDIIVHDSSRGVPGIPILTRNVESVRVIVYQVDPEKDFDFSPLGTSCKTSLEKDPLKVITVGKKVSDYFLKTLRKENQYEESSILPVKFLQNEKEILGHLLFFIEPKDWNISTSKPRKIVWLQCTKIGIDYMSSPGMVYGWANSLKDGSTLPDAEFSYMIGNKKHNGDTISGGIAAIQTDFNRDFVLLVQNGNDKAFLNVNILPRIREVYQTLIFDDQRIYKPLETVNIQGIIRKVDYPFKLLLDENFQIFYEVTDLNQKSFGKGTITPDQNGFFMIKFQIPKEIKGQCNVDFNAPSLYKTHTFFVEDEHVNSYLSLDFKPGNVFSNETKVFTAKLNHSKSANSSITWLLTYKKESFCPSSFYDFNFVPKKDDNQIQTQSFNGKLDIYNQNSISISFKEIISLENSPMSFVLKANVTTTDNLVFTKSCSFFYYPSSLLVGVRNDRIFLDPVKNCDTFCEFIVTNVYGQAIPDVNIHLKMLKDGNAHKDIFIVSKDKPEKQKLFFDENGTYSMIATVTDSKGLVHSTTTEIIVKGQINLISPSIKRSKALLYTDKSSYNLGETAEILIQSPFKGVIYQGLLLVQAEDLELKSSFSMKDTFIAKIPISKEMFPNANIIVYIVGYFNMKDVSYPVHCFGKIQVKILSRNNSLALSIPNQKDIIYANSKVDLEVSVSDKNGKEIENSAVSLIVMDENVIVQNQNNIEHPLKRFYPDRNDEIIDFSSRSLMILQKPKIPEIVIKEKKKNDRFVDHEVRHGLKNPLSPFLGLFQTDKEGKIKTNITLPNQETKYKVLALGMNQLDKFGFGEGLLDVKSPIQIKTSFPEYLYVGDKKVLFKVNVQNNFTEPIELKCILILENLECEGEKSIGYSMVIDSLKETSFNFKVDSIYPCDSKFSIVFEVEKKSIKIVKDFKIPVYHCSLKSKITYYGEIEEGLIYQPISIQNTEFFKNTGEFSLTVSTTKIYEFIDVFIQILNQEYESIEQIASINMLYAALKDVIYQEEFPGLPNKIQLQKIIEDGLEKLLHSQQNHGGFGLFDINSPTNPFLSVYVTHSLLKLDPHFHVPESLLKNCKEFLLNIDQNMGTFITDESTKNTIKAYSLYILNMGKEDKKKILTDCRNLFGKTGLDKLSLEGVSWLIQTLNSCSDMKDSDIHIKLMMNFIKSLAIQSEKSVHFMTSYGNDGKSIMYYTFKRTDSIVLEALLNLEKDSELVPKLVHGIYENRHNGLWNTSLESVFSILALKRYYDQSLKEKQKPDLITKFWINNEYGEEKFVGRTKEFKSFSLSLTELSKNPELVLFKSGKGDLHYRVNINISNFTKMIPLDNGFFIDKSVESVTNSLIQLKNGNLKIKQGELLKVKITLITHQKRHYVVLVDHLPSCFKYLSCESIEKTWYDYKVSNQEKVYLFSNYIPNGSYEFLYYVYAPFEGSFVTYPVTVEEMFSPEINGRSSSQEIDILNSNDFETFKSQKESKKEAQSLDLKLLGEKKDTPNTTPKSTPRESTIKPVVKQPTPREQETTVKPNEFKPITPREQGFKPITSRKQIQDESKNETVKEVPPETKEVTSEPIKQIDTPKEDIQVKEEIKPVIIESRKEVSKPIEKEEPKIVEEVKEAPPQEDKISKESIKLEEIKKEDPEVKKLITQDQSSNPSTPTRVLETKKEEKLTPIKKKILEYESKKVESDEEYTIEEIDGKKVRVKKSQNLKKVPVKIEGRTTPVSEAIKIFDRKESQKEMRKSIPELKIETKVDVKKTSILNQFSMDTPLTNDDDNITINFGAESPLVQPIKKDEISPFEIAQENDIKKLLSKSDLKKFERLKQQFESQIVSKKEYDQKKQEIFQKYQ